MGCDQGDLPNVRQLHSNVTTLQARASQDSVAGTWAHNAQTPWVGYSVDLVQQGQVCEVVHVNLVQQNDYHPVSTKSNTHNVASEAKLSDAPVLVVVPNHDLVWWEAGHSSTPNKGQDVASKQHLHNTHSAAGEISTKRFLERLAVVDAETSVSANSEATIILVEGDPQEPRGGGGL